MKKIEPVVFSAAVEKVWQAVQATARDAEWTVEDLIAGYPDIVPERSNNPARSVGKCMTTLIKHGRVQVTGRYCAKGSSKGCNLYKRTPMKCWKLPEAAVARRKVVHQDEPKSPVTRQTGRDGVTHVRFGVGWKPAHPEANSRALRGWVCPLEYL